MTALLVSLLAVAAAPSGVATAPAVLQQADVEERLGFPVPLDLRFRDEAGREVALGAGGGPPIVLVLAYYRCPMLCGVVLKGALEAAAALDVPHRLVAVSFDPADTPEAAQAARTRQGELARDAAFLVGDGGAIARLTQAVGYRYAWDEATQQFAHPAVVVVLTGDGRVSRYLYGVTPPPRDLRLAVLEAGEGRIGSVVDRVILACFRWDPAMRRYGPAIQTFVRLGSFAIFVGVVILLAFLWRRDRRLHAGGGTP